MIQARPGHSLKRGMNLHEQAANAITGRCWSRALNSVMRVRSWASSLGSGLLYRRVPLRSRATAWLVMAVADVDANEDIDGVMKWKRSVLHCGMHRK